jgi:lipid-A-disaccharide synthase
MRIGIIAAEPSGDLLAAGLMQALQDELPNVCFEGVGGPLMRQVGMDLWEPMDSLSVMGLFEVLRHLPRLLSLRGELLRRWREAPPVAFIGVDAPDFNLKVEQRLREAGVATVHYVSPTVWAWRTGRVRKIRRSVDLLLAILPFEKEFLARYGVTACYVGHPLAHEMPLQPDRQGARSRLSLRPESPTLALLPGSRRGEVARIAGPFIATALRLLREIPDLQVVVPLVNPATRELFEKQLLAAGCDCPSDSGMSLVQGESRTAMAAADAMLVASGTATLEGLLSKCPMVVGYRVSPATYMVVNGLRLIKTEHVALANLLVGERLAPELIQDECEPDHLLPPLLELFRNPARRAEIAARYAATHEALRKDSNREAAAAVAELLRERGLV